VIFSSRTVPGNEMAVGRVINGLVRQSIEVITEHRSGSQRRYRDSPWRSTCAIIYGQPLMLKSSCMIAFTT